MFEIKLTVEMPDLLKAAELLVNCAIKVADAKKAGREAELERVQACAKTETPVAPYTAPAMPLPDPTPAPAPVTAPTAAPSFTIAQVSRAGAMLLTAKPELQGELMGLLGRFGAKTAQELPQDRLGEFAAELRRMGANI